MIALPFDPAAASADPNSARGHAAEQQLAHDLGRAYSDAPDIHVYHGLRFPAPRTAPHTRDSDHTQIDHLIVHRHGMVIVESKTTGGYDRGVFHVDARDQWERRPDGRGRGFNMPSPVEQAARQAESLRLLLQNAQPPLLDKIAGVLQQKFTNFPIVTLVAIADNTRLEGPGAKQHDGTVMKAEKVVARVREEVEGHARRAGFLGLVRGAIADEPANDRGMYNLSDAALARIKYHLLKVHRPPAPTTPTAPTPPKSEIRNPQSEISAPPALSREEWRQQFRERGRANLRRAAEAAEAAIRNPLPTIRPEALTCRHCRSINVQPVYRRDYCLLCDECGKHTPLSRGCTQCGNPNATIHKRGGEFYRACSSSPSSGSPAGGGKSGCGAEVVFWSR